MTVGENIRRRRKQLRLTQAQLGSLIGVTGDTISRIELRSDLKLSRLRQIAGILACTAENLQDPDWPCPAPHELFELPRPG